MGTQEPKDGIPADVEYMRVYEQLGYATNWRVTDGHYIITASKDVHD